jgi:hypothetical protein
LDPQHLIELRSSRGGFVSRRRWDQPSENEGAGVQVMGGLRPNGMFLGNAGRERKKGGQA